MSRVGYIDNNGLSIVRTIMDEEAVRRYVEHAQSTIESSPQMGEATTKAAVLRDFLELLGWEIPTNTELEYPVKAFGRTFKVDYALVLEGAPVAFLEAKGVDTPFTDDHREQIQEYMKSEDVNLGILTNSEEYAFFRRQVIDSKVKVNTLAEINLRNLSDKITILRAFTKDAIQNDEWVKILNRIRELKEARTTLENMKDDLATEVTKLLTENVSGPISSPAESQAKEMIDRLVNDIEQEIDSNGTISSEEETDETPPAVPETSTDMSGEYIIKIQDDETTLTTFSDNNQSDVMANAVKFLTRDHDLIAKIEPLPYIPGREKAIINESPTSPHDEDAMRTYRELNQGYYLDTHMSKDSKKRHLRRLANKCGLEVEFEGGW